MRSTLAPILAALVLASCGVTEENASIKYARAWCDQYKTCERGDFDSRYESMSECVVENESYFDDVMDFFDLLGCEMDEGAATRTIRDLRSATCEEWVNGDWGDEEDVFVCGGGD